MSINTYSTFTYGHTITDENKYIQFNEGSGEITAEIKIGSYTLGSFVNAIADAMNSAVGSGLEYTASIDRVAGNKITVSAASNFSFLAGSGSLASQSAFSLMGFDSVDLSGSDSYQGINSSGESFTPQYLLQSYVGFENNVKTIQATVNQTANGRVEVVSYGKVRFMQCNITLQTDIKQGEGSLLRTDLNGVGNLRSFLDYATTKAPIEFIQDETQPNFFVDCLLESTPESQDGVDYRVKELYTRGLANYFESGLLEFRELT